MNEYVLLWVKTSCDDLYARGVYGVVYGVQSRK